MFSRIRLAIEIFLKPCLQLSKYEKTLDESDFIKLWLVILI